jgi:hypothetical protein
VLLRLAINHSTRPSRQFQLESVRHDRPIRLWRAVYGRWCNDVGIRKPTYALTRCAFYLTCKFPLELPFYWLTFPPRSNGIPAWKRLIDHSLTPDGRISLIKNIFSDRDEIEAVQQLSGDDAQSFVEVIDEVLCH